MTRMERWLAYFANKLNQREKEELAMLNPEIAEAMDASERYLMDENAYREYLQRESAIWDYNNDIIGSRAEGAQEKAIRIVHKLLERKTPVEDIADIVELPVDEVRDIAAKHGTP